MFLKQFDTIFNFILYAIQSLVTWKRLQIVCKTLFDSWYNVSPNQYEVGLFHLFVGYFIAFNKQSSLGYQVLVAPVYHHLFLGCWHVIGLHQYVVGFPIACVVVQPLSETSASCVSSGVTYCKTRSLIVKQGVDSYLVVFFLKRKYDPCLLIDFEDYLKATKSIMLRPLSLNLLRTVWKVLFGVGIWVSSY